MHLLSSVMQAGSSLQDPVLQIMIGAHGKTTSVFFNSSNHEYYKIPVMVNVFDSELAVRIVPTLSEPTGTAAQEPKIPGIVLWEQGMTLCLWYRFASLSGAWQTLFEMSNGFGTERVYVQRHADTRDLVLGVMHTSGEVGKEFLTSSSSAIVEGGGWNHLCWTIQHLVPENMTVHGPGSSSVGEKKSQILPESFFWSSLPTSRHDCF
jgi:hypothetical protein